MSVRYPWERSSGRRRSVRGSNPWIRYRNSGLYVIPSRHWSLEFVSLALRSGIEQFDKVCVELRSSLSVDYVLDAVRSLRGATGAILTPMQGPFTRRIPEFRGDKNPVERSVFLSCMTPVVPDSILTALRRVADLGPSGPSVEFLDVDLPQRLQIEDRESAFPYVDPQEVIERGLEGWYARWEPLLRRLPRTPGDTVREIAMATRLRSSVLLKDCKALFICGAAHWPRISDLLDGREAGHFPEAAVPKTEQASRLVTISPTLFFSWGRLDIPSVAWDFEGAVYQGNGRFDRDASIQRLLGRAYESARRSVSTRTLLVMQQYLRRRMLTSARRSCDLDEHLLESARAAAGLPFAYVLEREAMKHGAPVPADVPAARVVSVGRGRFFILFDKEAHLVTVAPPSTSGVAMTRPLRIPHPADLTDNERKHMKNLGWLMMKPPCEERLHKHMCDLARWSGHQLAPERRDHRTIVYRGNLAAGIDYRRTLRARAAGQTTVYVRHRIRNARNIFRCEECPVVWVFHAQDPVVHSVGDYFPDDRAGGHLYTSFFWFSQRRSSECVRRNTIAFFVRLYRNVTPSWDKMLVDRLLLSRLPPDKRCHTAPWSDKELSPLFSGPDLAVVCAVKWACGDHVVIVGADPSYTVGQAAMDYAREKEVRLLCTHAESFDRILLDRYEIDHEVPTAGAWHRPDDLCLRFVEPVPGFDSDSEGGFYETGI